jgi:hypothetical protein
MVVLVLVISVLVVAVVSIVLGRWLQRRGSEIERSGRRRRR